mmetsp:Transcript_70784/g.207372  ORF Transcript_70784/g.207372 Transcript_70784/m.207372 type:complete len:397 (-) Transcript_70784:46-1236(-)
MTSQPNVTQQVDHMEEEVTHFLSVCYSIAGYTAGSLPSVELYGKELQVALEDPENRRLWCGDDLSKILEQMKVRVTYNQRFLDDLVRDLAECPVGPPGGLGRRTPPPGVLRVPHGYAIDPGNASKTRSTLRQFVRDWAREGAVERKCCYEPLLLDLEKYVPLAARPGGPLPKVLTPGSGLGRLTFEAAIRGYFAEGNEFSYHMLLGTAWVLNDSGQALGTTIFPYIVDTAGRRGAYDHMRPVCIPDICPGDFCDPASGFGEISMRSGEFVEVYKKQLGEWDAVLTAFFVDTAHNIFLYVRVLAAILRPGGLWANVGPLLWHYAPEGGGPADAVSVELSWEELRPAVEVYFEIRELEQQEAHYTDGAIAGKKKRYRCLHFAAVRNGTPVVGESSPVW